MSENSNKADAFQQQGRFSEKVQLTISAWVQGSNRANSAFRFWTKQLLPLAQLISRRNVSYFERWYNEM